MEKEIYISKLPFCHERVMLFDKVKIDLKGKGKSAYETVDKTVNCVNCKYGRDMSATCGFYRKPHSFMVKEETNELPFNDEVVEAGEKLYSKSKRIPEEDIYGGI